MSEFESIAKKIYLQHNVFRLINTVNAIPIYDDKGRRITLVRFIEIDSIVRNVSEPLKEELKLSS